MSLQSSRCNFFSLLEREREREEENHETALFSPSLLPSSPYVPFDIHRRPGDTYLLFPIAKLQIISRRNCGTAGEKSGGRRRGEEGREIDGASNGQIYLAEEAEHATRNIRGVSYEEIDKESPLSPFPHGRNTTVAAVPRVAFPLTNNENLNKKLSIQRGRRPLPLHFFPYIYIYIFFVFIKSTPSLSSPRRSREE